jgi:hypothetical protein
MGEDDLMTTAELSRKIKKPVGTLRQWRHRGFGPAGFRVGGTVVYRRSVVEAWITEQERAESQRAPYRPGAA